MNQLEKIIHEAWEQKETLSPRITGEIQEAVRATLSHLDEGTLRVATKEGNNWIVHAWIKKAILLSFRLHDNFLMVDDFSPSFDKVPLKFEEWTEEQFSAAQIRVVPGSIVRHSAYISPHVVLMPSFVNVGAYVGEGTMIDTGARVGSCAQVGAHCHISGGAGIGGVLEPLQANPVIIEDDCFIGANSEVAEGAIIGEGAVLSTGVFITASTKIIDRETGEIIYGHVPPYAVVVPGTLPGKLLPDGSPGPGLACAVIVKRVDVKTRSKVSINELLRS